MFKKASTRKDGKIYISTFEIKRKKDREEFCELFLKTGKIFIIEEEVVSSKYVSLTDPVTT